MCTISNNLKLCSCSFFEEDEPDHYWTLFRLMEGKENIIIGETMIPSSLFCKDYDLNYKALQDILNVGNAFDFEPSFVKGDLLNIKLKMGFNNERCSFGFEFDNNTWQIKEEENIGWYWHHDFVNGGKIENIFIKPV